MSKTLSNGTLSLRFMQNALRAKNNAVTEAQKAPVKGADEWHVPASVKEAWGITGGEASYVHSAFQVRLLNHFLLDKELHMNLHTYLSSLVLPRTSLMLCQYLKVVESLIMERRSHQ